MLTKQYPLPVKFICAFIYSDNANYVQAKNKLIDKFGPVDFESKAIAFNFTDYYQPEMGTNLTRRFIAFKELRSPDEFVAIKNFCIDLEAEFAQDNKRAVNIDPGYLNEAKLILTTTKDFSHRIYLNDGIYAEVTLTFHKGEFRNLETTFPDYRTSAYKDILAEIRKTYRQQLNINR